jgi:hypothetical protein
VLNNLCRIGLSHALPMELRCVRVNRASKAKHLVEAPLIANMVFVAYDVDRIERFLNTKYTVNVLADRNANITRIPDAQMMRFLDQVEVWNEGVRKQFEGGKKQDRKARKEWKQATIETLAALKETMFGVEEMKDAA